MAYLARRAEGSNGESPSLQRAPSGLVESDGEAPDSEEVLKPLALAFLMDYLLKKSRQTADRE